MYCFLTQVVDLKLKRFYFCCFFVCPITLILCICVALRQAMHCFAQYSDLRVKRCRRIYGLDFFMCTW